MGYLEGLLGGFTGRKREVELRTQQENDLAQQRENKIIDALVNSPDPEVRSHGISALLDSASPKPKMKGLRGFLGEVQGSPHLSTIQSIVQADRDSGAVAPGGQLSTPPGEAPAAQATTSPTVGGPPPTVEPSLARDQEGQPLTVEPSLGRTAEGAPVTPEVTGPPPSSTGPAGAPPLAVLGKETPAPRRQPRQILQTPEGQMLLNKKASAQGDVQGMVEGLVASGVPREEAVATVQQHMRRQYGAGLGPGAQSIAGEAPDENGAYQPVFAVFDKATKKYMDANPDSATYGLEIPGFRPRSTTAGGLRTAGMDREALSLAGYGMRFEQLAKTNPQAAQQVLAQERDLIQGKATARTYGAGVGNYTKPIGVTEAQKTNVPVGSTSEQFAGQQVASEAEQGRRRGVENVNSQLDHIKTLLVALPKNAELGGLAPGATLAIRRRSPQYRAQVATLDAAIDNILASLSRTIQENRGAQTEKDAERAYSTIAAMKGSLLDPLAGDTQESAAARIAETQGYLQTILGTLPGNPVPQAVGAPPPAAAAPAAATPAGAPPAPVKPGAAKPVGAKPGAGGSPNTYQDAQGAWHIRSIRENQF